MVTGVLTIFYFIFTGMTKIKMSGPNDVSPPIEFLERRRASLERFLQRTAAHPVLGVDPDFREFLISGICFICKVQFVRHLVLVTDIFKGSTSFYIYNYIYNDIIVDVMGYSK